ncbi:MAG: hypothetical protein IT223_00915 [Crocinitomicaceae bacterium]|nr:hypothetical protein [Crocinitomicaceae bacterium]
MKKIIGILLFSTPFFFYSQTKGTTATAPAPAAGTRETAKAPAGQSKFGVFNPETIYIELIVGETTMGTSIRVDYGRELLNGLNDKELINQISDLRSASFSSVPDAMNYLTSIGFRYLSSYNVTVNTKSEAHLLFDRRLSRKAANNGQSGVTPAIPATPSVPASPANKGVNEPRPSKAVKPETKDKK